MQRIFVHKVRCGNRLLALLSLLAVPIFYAGTASAVDPPAITFDVSCPHDVTDLIFGDVHGTATLICTPGVTGSVSGFVVLDDDDVHIMMNGMAHTNSIEKMWDQEIIWRDFMLNRKFGVDETIRLTRHPRDISDAVFSLEELFKLKMKMRSE